MQIIQKKKEKNELDGFKKITQEDINNEAE